jgi:phosphomevalonate kinase
VGKEVDHIPKTRASQEYIDSGFDVRFWVFGAIGNKRNKVQLQ